MILHPQRFWRAWVDLESRQNGSCFRVSRGRWVYLSGSAARAYRATMHQTAEAVDSADRGACGEIYAFAVRRMSSVLIFHRIYQSVRLETVPVVPGRAGALSS